MAGIPVQLVGEGVDWPAWVQAVGSIAAIMASTGLILLERRLRLADEAASRLTVKVLQDRDHIDEGLMAWHVQPRYTPHDFSAGMEAVVTVRGRTAGISGKRADLRHRGKWMKVVTIGLTDDVDEQGVAHWTGDVFVFAEGRDAFEVRMVVRQGFGGKPLARRKWRGRMPKVEG